MSRIRNIGGKKTHAHGPFDRIISKRTSFYSYLSKEFFASFVTGEGTPPVDEGRVGGDTDYKLYQFHDRGFLKN
jgi:hypothetical protein